VSSRAFEGPRRQDLLDAALRRLKARQVADPVWESQILLARCLGVERLELLRDPSVEVEEVLRERFADWLQRYLDGEPLAYLEGVVGFFGRMFQVDSRVLVPRADSECVVEACLDWAAHQEPGCLVDIGTGSGCLLLTLLAELPEWRGVGIDYSEAALQVAGVNRIALGLQDRCSLLQGSWLSPMAPAEGLALVLSNPPYVVPGEELGPGVVEHEPHLALFTPEGDAMGPYRTILDQADGCLRKDGALVFEVGAQRAKQVAQMGQSGGFRHLETRCDLGGVERAVVLEREASS
jgi:release factor glutamine methyltransferase